MPVKFAWNDLYELVGFPDFVEDDNVYRDGGHFAISLV